MAPLIAMAIVTTAMSNSSTGGVVVSNNSDNTSGYSYSSVSVQTTDNNGVGSSTVQIETDNNGQVHTQTITKPIVPNMPVNIIVATSTVDGSSSVQVSSFSGTSYGPIAPLGFNVFSLFRNLFAFFRW